MKPSDFVSLLFVLNLLCKLGPLLPKNLILYYDLDSSMTKIKCKCPNTGFRG